MPRLLARLASRGACCTDAGLESRDVWAVMIMGLYLLAYASSAVYSRGPKETEVVWIALVAAGILQLGGD